MTASTLQGHAYGGDGGRGGNGGFGGYGPTLGQPGSPGAAGGQGGAAIGGAIAILGGAFNLSSSAVLSAAIAGSGGKGGVGGEDGPCDYNPLNGSQVYGPAEPSGAGGNGGNALGGAIDLVNGTLTITNSTLSNSTDTWTGLPTVTGGAGGVGGNGLDASYKAGYYGPPGNGGTGGNGGLGFGGAIEVSGGMAILIADTIYANQASGGAGGAGGSLGNTLYGTGQSGNPGTAGAGQGGGIAVQGGAVGVLDTIVAGNTASTTGPDAFGAFGSQGYNLVGDGTSSTGFASTGDQVGSANQPIGPKLGPLQYNGGPTETLALLPGSPAINAGGPLAALAVQVGPADTTLTIANGSAMPAVGGSFAVQIDGEQMLVSYLSGNTFTILQRGYEGTTAAGHNAQASVFLALDQRGQPRDFNGLTDIGAFNLTTPIVTWATPSAITYGTPLSGAQLNASANVPGTFTYSQAAGTVLSAGPQTLTATFTPTDTTDYATVTVSRQLQVNPATLTVTANNASMVYGSTIPNFTDTITGFVNGDNIGVVSGSANLSTTATSTSAVGTYSISAAQGTLSATNYTFAYQPGILTITPAPAALSISDGGPYTGLPQLAHGSALGVDGKTPVAGAWTYTYFAGKTPTGTPLAGPPTNLGTYTVVGVFTSSDPNYTGGSAQSTFTITKGMPTLSVTDNGGAYTGKPYAAKATVTGGNGASLGTPTLSYYKGTTASGTKLSGPPTTVGTYTVVAMYAGSANYNAASAQHTFTITKAAPTFSNLHPSQTIRYGTASVLLTGHVGVPGTTLVPPAGEPLTVTINGVKQATKLGTNGSFSLTFSTSNLPRGSYPITYSYGGDANFRTTTDASTTLTIA